jgi:hypothetical protein
LAEINKRLEMSWKNFPKDVINVQQVQLFFVTEIMVVPIFGFEAPYPHFDESLWSWRQLEMVGICGSRGTGWGHRNGVRLYISLACRVTAVK